jgi:hypothetical protein
MRAFVLAVALVVSLGIVANFLRLIDRSGPHRFADRLRYAMATGDLGAVTLAQAQVNTLNDIDFSVIDNLRRYSWLFDQIVFDDTVNPGTGGGTLTYGYTRLSAVPSTDFRQINEEYAPSQATRTRQTVDLKPLGGAFNLDRVLAKLGPAQTNELTFQMQQLLVSIRIRFQRELILGDTAVNSAGFDGLSKALTGTNTEVTAGSIAGSNDWTPATVNTQALANTRLDEVDDFLSRIVPSHVGGGDAGTQGAVPPGVLAILGNTKSIARLRALARWASLFTSEKDDLGRQIEKYGPYTLVDLGDREDGSAPIIPITAGGLTDLYAVSFGLDALHGASVAGVPLVQTWMPDWTVAGAVKTGEIEMGPVAMALKNTRACAVLRGIKVQ